MKRFAYLLLFAAILMALLVGCINSQLPVYVITESGIEPSSYNAAERDAYCASSFDATAAFSRSRKEEPLLWTFGVNFTETSPLGNPVGCLRLFQRPESIGISQALTIDNGGILVDTCHRVGEWEPEEIENGRAHFVNQGFIMCAMNLKEWTTSISNSHIITDVLPNTREILAFFADSDVVHSYENFTLQATVAVSNSTAVSAVVPILYYMADNSGLGDPITFSIAIEDEVVVTALSPCTQTISAESLSVGEMADWWYDVRSEQQTLQGPPTEPNLNYVARKIGQADTTLWCDAGPTPPVSFVIGPAMLYIGFDPHTGTTFHGIMESILIDPTDSKPPALN